MTADEPTESHMTAHAGAHVELVQQLTEQIVWRVADVRGWPDWMQASCLGRDQKPIVARVLRAALESGAVVPASVVQALPSSGRRKPATSAGGRPSAPPSSTTGACARLPTPTPSSPATFAPSPSRSPNDR